MAWRIAPHILRGEIDNRVKGFVTGRIWLQGHDEPLTLNLFGHPEPDLAGRLLEFVNPNPDDTTQLTGLIAVQEGLLGEFTAARRIKVPSIPLEQMLSTKGSFPFCWKDCLYLEWFSDKNGRVVIETLDFDITRSDPAWELTTADRTAQRKLNECAWEVFMKSLALCLGPAAQDSDEVPVRLDPDQEDEEVIEQLLRINDLKHEADRLAGGQLTHDSFEPLPLAVEEQFWKNVVELEKAPFATRRELLVNAGIFLPAPEALDEKALSAALWAVIRGLAAHCMYLTSTDHLSDRQLYELLISAILDEPVAVLQPGSGWNNHICVEEHGTPEEEPHIIYLRFYADEEDRKRWATAFPDEDIPPREQPPYDRDRHLPRPEGYGGSP